MSEESKYLSINGNMSRETIKTAAKEIKNGRRAVKIDSKTIVFAKDDKNDEQVREEYRNRSNSFDSISSKPSFARKIGK